MGLKGIKVTLVNKKQIGLDGYNAPVYEEVMVDIDDVLIYPSSSSDVVDSMNLYGKKAVYTLALPKHDNHEWEDQDVIFFGQRFHVFTPVTKGIESLIPLRWNAKIQVEKYD